MVWESLCTFPTHTRASSGIAEAAAMLSLTLIFQSLYFSGVGNLGMRTLSASLALLSRSLSFDFLCCFFSSLRMMRARREDSELEPLELSFPLAELGDDGDGEGERLFLRSLDRPLVGLFSFFFSFPFFFLSLLDLSSPSSSALDG